MSDSPARKTSAEGNLAGECSSCYLSLTGRFLSVSNCKRVCEQCGKRPPANAAAISRQLSAISLAGPLASLPIRAGSGLLTADRLQAEYPCKTLRGVAWSIQNALERAFPSAGSASLPTGRRGHRRSPASNHPPRRGLENRPCQASRCLRPPIESLADPVSFPRIRDTTRIPLPTPPIRLTSPFLVLWEHRFAGSHVRRAGPRLGSRAEICVQQNATSGGRGRAERAPGSLDCGLTAFHHSHPNFSSQFLREH